MRILCVGGGSGGHITPIVAVVEKLRSDSNDPNDLDDSNNSSGSSADSEKNSPADIRVWCDRGFSAQARELFGDATRVDIIASGKWRRYTNLSLRTKLRYHLFRTYLMNFLDLFKIALGLIQSFVKLIIWRPDVIFMKGGFVCLPVGFAARILKIPFVIHDSDTTPGLANRVLARWAAAIGTGSPVENYPNYPADRTKFIGVPIRDGIHEFSESERNAAKTQLGFDANKKMILVTGGGQGAASLNEIIAQIAPKIIKDGAQILLMAGQGNVAKIQTPKSKNFKIVEFLTDEYLPALTAADAVLTRAGATTMAEMAAAAKAVIIVPNSHLAGDHQTKNADVYKEAGAAIVLDQLDLEKSPEILVRAIDDVLYAAKLRENLSRNLARFARPNALNEIVEMILRVGKNKKKRRK